MIEIFKDSKIFIVSVAQVATGGPELLHQFASKLNLLGFDAYMIYVGEYTGDPVPPQYKKYNIKYTDKIEDNPRNLIIVPEVLTMLLYKHKNIRKAIWWLSKDNYYEVIKKFKDGWRAKNSKVFLVM